MGPEPTVNMTSCSPPGPLSVSLLASTSGRPHRWPIAVVGPGVLDAEGVAEAEIEAEVGPEPEPELPGTIAEVVVEDASCPPDPLFPQPTSAMVTMVATIAVSAFDVVRVDVDIYQF